LPTKQSPPAGANLPLPLFCSKIKILHLHHLAPALAHANYIFTCKTYSCHATGYNAAATCFAKGKGLQDENIIENNEEIMINILNGKVSWTVVHCKKKQKASSNDR